MSYMGGMDIEITKKKTARGISNPLRPALPRRMYSVKDAASYLGISEWNLRDLLIARVFPVLRHGERGKIYIDVANLDVYIQKNKTSTAEADHNH